MADNTILNTNVTSGDVIATEDISGVKHELVKVEFGVAGVATKVSDTDPMPVTDANALTDIQLRATPVPVSGTVTVDTSTLATGAKQDTGNTSLASIDTKLTNPLPVSAASLPLPALAATSTKQSDGSQKSQVVDGSGNVIGATSNALDINIKSGNISGFATSAKQDTGNSSLASIDSKLTNPLPVSGTVTTGGLTDTQLRATAVPVSNTNLDVALSTRTKPSDQQHAIIDSGTITTVSAVTVISNALPAGNNNIGDVDVASLPAIPAGSNLIGIVQSKDIPDSSATYALTNVSSTAYETGHILKGSAGYLFMVTGYNSKTSAQFIQLHNTTTVPADSSVPVLIFTVPASSNFSLDLGKYGRYFSTGISICNSSTGPTKTVGTTDCWFDAQVI